jgi:hypothetical protein
LRRNEQAADVECGAEQLLDRAHPLGDEEAVSLAGAAAFEVAR